MLLHQKHNYSYNCRRCLSRYAWQRYREDKVGNAGLTLEVHREHMNKMRTLFDYFTNKSTNPLNQNAYFTLRLEKGGGIRDPGFLSFFKLPHGPHKQINSSLLLHFTELHIYHQVIPTCTWNICPVHVVIKKKKKKTK